MLPALGGEHIFAFHGFSIHRNQHAHRFCDFQKCASCSRWGAHFSFLSTFITSKNTCQSKSLAFSPFLTASWGHLESSWDNFGPSWAQLGSTWGQLGPTWGQGGPTWVQLGLTWANLGPTWGKLAANLGSTCGQLGAKVD